MDRRVLSLFFGFFLYILFDVLSVYLGHQRRFINEAIIICPLSVYKNNTFLLKDGGQ